LRGEKRRLLICQKDAHGPWQRGRQSRTEEKKPVNIGAWLALCHPLRLFCGNAGSHDNFEATICETVNIRRCDLPGEVISTCRSIILKNFLSLCRCSWLLCSEELWAGSASRQENGPAFARICWSVFLRCFSCVSGLVLIGDAAARFPSGALRADPTRTIEALAVGISFIGAGTIFRDRSGTGMLGLTTAAGLLVAASIGIAVAINRYIVACGITLISFYPSHVEPRGKAIETKSIAKI
jgi:hypothetical protein